MSEMVGRVARAIEDVRARRRQFGNQGIPDSEAFARAAIEAMRVPTEAMVVEVLQTAARDVPAERMWQAMIDEALK